MGDEFLSDGVKDHDGEHEMIKEIVKDLEQTVNKCACLRKNIEMILSNTNY